MIHQTLVASTLTLCTLGGTALMAVDTASPAPDHETAEQREDVRHLKAEIAKLREEVRQLRRELHQAKTQKDSKEAAGPREFHEQMESHLKELQRQMQQLEKFQWNLEDFDVDVEFDFTPPWGFECEELIPQIEGADGTACAHVSSTVMSVVDGRVIKITNTNGQQRVTVTQDGESLVEDRPLDDLGEIDQNLRRDIEELASSVRVLTSIEKPSDVEDGDVLEFDVKKEMKMNKLAPTPESQR